MATRTATRKPSDDNRLAGPFTGCVATSVRLIASAYDEALRPLGIRSTQVTMLVEAASFEGPTASDLVLVLHID